MINASEKQFFLASRLLKEGQVEECMNELSLLLIRYPDHGRGNALLGHLFMRHLSDYSQAETCFNQALRFDALYPELYYDFADLLIQIEKYTEAIAVLNKAFEIPGIEKNKLYRWTGMIYEKQKDFDQAILNYTQAIYDSFSDAFIQLLKSDIKRCLMKKAG
jgi:tetratricopeptide (TPR) repeat protein